MDTHSTPKRLEFHLEGDPRAEGLVLAQDFVAFLSSVLNALRRVEGERSRKPNTVYRIVELELGSAVVALQPESPEADTDVIIGDFLAGLAAVRDGTIDRLGYQPETKRAFIALLAPLRDKHLRSISVQVESVEIQLQSETITPLRLRGGPELHTIGVLSGYIDAINVHREPLFFLYPVAGPSRVRCVFDRLLLDEVRAALKRFVTVHGLLEYAEGSPFPSRITVERVEAHPPEEELASLESLFGSVPDLTGGVDSVSYIRAHRDAQE